MRGYFGIGVEGISKAMNAGAIFRTAHAFGASFVFTANATYRTREVGRSDTSDALSHIPFYQFPDTASVMLPNACRLVGVELTDESIELPSFRHPANAAYVLGPERGSLSPEMTERCEFVVKIPTQFCINVGLAAALVMYDRTLNLGRYPQRPDRAGGPVDALPDHEHGSQKIRNAAEKYRAEPPLYEPEGAADD